VAPGVVQYTSDLLFHDLWLRPPWRLGTGAWLLSALSSPQAKSCKIPYHLNRAMDLRRHASSER
jgi:4-carboxymuconolactone decarboxylase